MTIPSAFAIWRFKTNSNLVGVSIGVSAGLAPSNILAAIGDDLRRQPLRERKLALSKLLIRSRGGIQYVEHTEGHGEKLFEVVCDLGLEGIVSKRLTSVYRSGPSKTWIKVKNPKAPAATRATDGTF
jgi:bifunctional non-homologous end joining protein LigD